MIDMGVDHKCNQQAFAGHGPAPPELLQNRCSTDEARPCLLPCALNQLLQSLSVDGTPANYACMSEPSRHACVSRVQCNVPPWFAHPHRIESGLLKNKTVVGAPWRPNPKSPGGRLLNLLSTTWPTCMPRPQQRKGNLRWRPGELSSPWVGETETCMRILVRI